MKKFLYWLIVLPIIGFISYLGFVYYSFYKNVKEVKDSVLRHTFESGPLNPPFASNDYVATWGAFGDFIGGTINPIIGLVSVILLFLTWMVTKDTLITTKKELVESTKAFNATADAQKEIQRTQSLQQFDTIFFSMINNLNNVYSILNESSIGNKESELDRCYRKCFGDDDSTLLERQYNIDDSHQLRKFFLMLYQIIKNLKNNISNNGNFDEKEKAELIRLYANILRSSLDNKILQLLLLNIYNRFEKYSCYLREFRIFEHMDFRNHNEKFYWNYALLEVVVKLGQQYFYTSDWYKELKENKLMKGIFSWENDFYNQNLFSKKYLKKYLDKKIIVYYQNSLVEIVFGTDSFNANNLRLSFNQDGNRHLNAKVHIFRDKFLLQKDSLYYQLRVTPNYIEILTSESKLKNFLPIDRKNFEIVERNPL
ncbi:hypothetical protein J647_2074 [Acinetobacter baumannii 846928]|nr:hypothetical protein J647_2074 [Acinetobacter baumannii 846928]